MDGMISGRGGVLVVWYWWMIVVLLGGGSSFDGGFVLCRLWSSCVEVCRVLC